MIISYALPAAFAAILPAPPPALQWALAGALPVLLLLLGVLVRRRRRAEAGPDFSALLSRLPTPVGVFDEELVLVYGNPALGRFLRRGPEELRRLDARHHTNDMGYQEDEKQFKRARRNGVLGPYRKLFVDKEENRHYAQVHGVAEQIDDKQYFVCLIEPDEVGAPPPMKPQKASQDGIHAWDPHSFSQVTAGIAHDMNNMVGPVIAYPEMMMEMLPEDSPLRHDVQEIRRAGTRLARIIQAMDNLAPKTTLPCEHVSLDRVVEDYLKSFDYASCQEKFPKVKLIVRKEPGMRCVEASYSHMAQVIAHLVDTAYDLVQNRGDGEVVIESSSYHLEPDQAGNRLGQTVDFGVLALRVNHPGFNLSELDDVFVPFFIRNRLGIRGNGLGLAAAGNLVRSMGGEIQMASSEGKGVTVVIRLPMAEEASAHELETSTCFRGSESILLVEDVIEQSRLAAKMLSSLGYRVDAAASGREAVELARKNRYDLVVSDLHLEPDYSGLDAFKDMLRINPRLRGVLVSGYNEARITEKAAQAGLALFLRKPLSVEKIGRAVRSALDGTLSPA